MEEANLSSANLDYLPDNISSKEPVSDVLMKVHAFQNLDDGDNLSTDQTSEDLEKADSDVEKSSVSSSVLQTGEMIHSDDEKNNDETSPSTASTTLTLNENGLDEDVAGNSDVEQNEERRSRRKSAVSNLTSMMVACKDGNYRVVQKLFEKGASVSETDMHGMTPLHYAALSGSEPIVKFLVSEQKDSVLATNDEGQTPLHLACTHSSHAFAIVKLLVKDNGEEAKLITDAAGETPFLLAVESGNKLVVRELLDSKAKEQLKIVKKDSGDSALHCCARKRNVDVARILLDSGSAVNLKNNDGQTALHIAAYEGQEAMINLLCSCNKMFADIQDKFDRTAVHIAAERGFSGIVEYLVDRVNVDINFRSKSGNTLLYIAAQNGHTNTVLALLNKRVPLHMPNKAGEVSLHAAVICGHVGVVETLLNKGAYVDCKTKDLYTALHIAVQHRKPKVVQTLLGYGANVHLKGGMLEETPLHIAAHYKDGTEVAEMLLKSGANVDVPQENGETSLHIATRKNNISMIELLLSEGANAARKSQKGEIPLHIAVENSFFDIAAVLVNHVMKSNLNLTHGVKFIVNSPNKKGETPLHYVSKLTTNKETGELDLKTANLLLKHGGNPRLETVDTKETCVHYCARSGNIDVLQALLNSISAEEVQRLVNAKSSNHLTPLLISSEKGNLDVTKTLMNWNARLDAFDEKGQTPLHLSCAYDHKDVAVYLLNSKPYINAKTKLGFTPLHLAAEKGYTDLVEMLVQFSASIDALSFEGQTPLHLAAEGGRLDVCKVLLHLQADTSVADNHGRTPLHCATQMDHSEVVKFFVKNYPQLVNQTNADGETCAHIAAAKGSISVIKELVKLKFNNIIEKITSSQISTPLLLAASGGHADVVQVLLLNGANATHMDKFGWTAIHLAARNGHNNVIDILKDKISLDFVSPKTGLSAAHIAAQYGQTEVMREILLEADVGNVKSQPNKTKKDEESGCTPLHFASRSGNEHVVRLLLNDPNVKVDELTTQNSLPLHMASGEGHANVVSLLLSKAPHQVDTKNKLGRTAFHLAASSGRNNVVTQLLAQGAQIDAEDTDGWTALHFSATSGHLKVVKQLIESGANITKETREGKVALCYATHSGDVAVLHYLLNLKFDPSLLLLDRTLNSARSLHTSFILRSPAPLYTAVKLSHHYRMRSVKVKERSKDLTAAGDFCEELAQDIMTLACATDASHLLNATDDEDKPFLDVMVDCEQKKCVAQNAVQSYLGSKWVAGRDWRTTKIVGVFFAALVLPPVWAVLSLPWKNNYNQVPLVKFICKLISHLYLILLFVFMLAIPWGKRGDDVVPAWYEVVWMFWLCGLFLEQLTDAKNKRGLGRLPILIIFLSIVGVLLHLSAIPFGSSTRLNLLYSRNQILAVAMFLSFVQLLDFLTFHYLFGPWGVIIGNLLQDVARFLVTLQIFILGFAMHLAAISKPAFEKKASKSVTLSNMHENFVEIFKFLVFTLFGSADSNFLDDMTKNNLPGFSKVLVYIVFGFYCLITIIVLINLLIAMMSDTYRRIQAQSDLEWKFGRAKLIRSLEQSTLTPAPLNLLTTAWKYIRLVHKLRCVCCRPDIIEVLREEISDKVEVPNIPGINAVSPDSSSCVVGVDGDSHRIKKVVNWREVVKKFKDLQGMELDDSAEVIEEQETKSANYDLNEKSVHDIKELVEVYFKRIGEPTVSYSKKA
ncbi:serine/threonine-protein phosphatase 6 regulatory ankyrin repeat subunit A-like [Xenia sp. Carnegie-2017]|uniref:serine/threonine-protein phosphatase 6 regulatory ankyrin repeat subunit A-like n=1 Tax=Xenia sp. Carnegie-2017 TaxID=2897299 RepID=UPI001F0448AB|nr:serine/threonine-protein phosphatase 6 regulatory ankyrin repeat subunit A-like [Xenia sp. Carnegie-2017]